MILRAALLVTLSLPLGAGAQDTPAVGAARQHLADAAGVAPGDLVVTDHHTDRRTGATFVHLAQQHAGVPIWGTASGVGVSADGRAVSGGDAFVTVEAARAGAPEPSVTPEAAQAAALAHAGVGRTGRARTRLSDAPGERAFIPASPLRAVGEPALVYQPVGDALRLAWAVTVEGDMPTAMWAIRVDAHTGAVLVADDLVRREPRPSAPPAAHTPTATAARGGGPAYRVIPFPFESPLASPFVLVPSPAARGGDASPFGWHDTDGAPGPEFTVTEGNNVVAYADQDGNNTPDPGSQPDGGPGLVFDFAYDPEQPPEASVEASVTNAFYWTNVLHDVLWAYGFDEPAGNFQANTYGRGGAGGDPYRVEVLDYDPFGQEDFSTPPDGSSPRMEQRSWSNGPLFTITAPSEIAGTYPASGAQFGGTAAVSADATVLLGAGGEAGRGCSAEEVSNPDAVSGTVAVVERGDCNFTSKARAAQALGAVGVAVYNCEPGADGCSTNRPGEDLVTMNCPDHETCGDVTLHSIFLARSTGLLLASAESPAVSIDLPPDRDGAYDAGLIAHEYGHGLSDRLTGGRFETGCLSNQEQMSEGWSDILGLLMTMQPGDMGPMPRGIAAYTLSQPADGGGVRPTPYSTDVSVNAATYDDVINSTTGSLSVPHGVGYVWGSMIWDMTWALIAEHGQGNLYDADGGAGNQIAMHLLVTAMKLQPCRPGFVDARDALFAADALLYGSAHSDAIGDVFAARGLGRFADQGSPDVLDDGTADFTPFPPVVAAEPGAGDGGLALAVSGPNPFRGVTTVTLRAGAPQAVTVDVLDLLGRRVATLFDGTLVGDAELALSAAGLPAGVYVVRAVGETVRRTERVTVLR